MADIQLLLKLGRELDFSGQELRDWVDRKAAEQKQREERAAERELKRLELEAQSQIATLSSQDSAPKIKLPPFDDRVDEIDAYIFRFEVHAHKYWPRDEWGTYFISLLRGRALTYFRELRFNPGDTLRVKDLMLMRFAHTEDVLTTEA